ncbi:YczE/YyaS/YitT family protein [Nocardia iowensis]|uniref:Membrane protein n=1 Tax=Nocardia iowensis TaxID=204891 RepID=A0ABX8RYH6_NOCIO|nr:membrane protein [Nocardia iowensis]QXN94618.1 membrane protein [Nocardia iowensis]
MIKNNIPLTVLPITIQPVRRLSQLLTGLTLYGASMAILLRAELGMSPWGSFQEGLSDKTGASYGLVTIIVGAVLLIVWIPMRQKPGIGTLANVIVVGVAADITLMIIDPPAALLLRILFLVSGVLLNGLSIAIYVGARLGPGPRDGLMTGLSPILGMSLRRVRTMIEVTVLAGGFLLGGTVGVGTLLYALTVGPIVQAALPRTIMRTTHGAETAVAPT